MPHVRPDRQGGGPARHEVGRCEQRGRAPEMEVVPNPRAFARLAVRCAAAFAPLLLPLPAAGHPGHTNTPPKAEAAQTCAIIAIPALFKSVELDSGSVSSIDLFRGTRACASYGQIGLIDPDGDDLTVTITGTSTPNTPTQTVVHHLTEPQLVASGTRVAYSGVAKHGPRSVTVSLKVADAHDAEVTTSVRFDIRAIPNNSVPAFGETVADKSYFRGREIESLVLPAASGGDLFEDNGSNVFDYDYAVDGLPAGLEFAPTTRTVSGTPTETGTFTITYTAEDSDRIRTPADTASLSFTVTVNPAPTVTGLAITSFPGADQTYQANDKIQVTVTFSVPVNVTGTPRIKFKFRSAHANTGSPFLTYESGSGTNELVFGYTVTNVNNSGTEGVGVPADKLELNGGTIKSVSDSADAILTHDALAHDVDHKVHGPTAQDTTAPELSTTTLPAVDGATLTVTFDENLDPNSVPAPDAFHVTVGAERRRVADNGVAISSATVTLTLASAVIDADTVKVRFDKPAQNENPLQDFSAGNDVESFTDQDVTNNTADVAPTVSSAVVSGTRLRVTFSENLDVTSEPAASQFTVKGAGADQHPTNVDIAGAVVTLTLGRAAVFGETITLDYTSPAANPLQDPVGNDVASFTGQAVDSDTTAPDFGRAAVAGDTLTITFNEALDTASKPAAGTFTVTVAGTNRGVSSVAISGDTVTLTLAAAVARGEAVQVRYARPTTGNKLRDFARNEVATFGNRAVTNRTPPALAHATVNRAAVTLTFDAALDTASEPAAAAFTVTVGGADRVVSNVAMFDDTVTLTLASAVGEGDTVTGSYRKPATSPLQDGAGNAVSDFSFTAENLTDTTAPRVSGAPAVNRARLVIAFDEDLDTDPDSVPDPEDFTVMVAGVRRDVAPGGVAVSGRELTLTLAAAVTAGQSSVTVSYTAGEDPLRDTDGNAVTNFGPAPLDVINNTPRPRQQEPEQERAPVADAGADIAVEPGAAVTLNGSASAGPDGEALTWAWSQVSGAPVTLSGAGTATPSFTAPRLPGALTFRLTVTDPAGPSHSDQVTVTVRDRAPSFGTARVPALTLLPGRAVSRVLPAATGGNGALGYRLTSEPAGLAGLTFDAASRRLSGTPATEGSWTFTYRADDADHNRAHSDAAVLTFGVTVGALETARSTVLRHTLAAIAARTLSRTLDSITPRFAASTPPTGLTLAGRAVPLGAGAGGSIGARQPCSPAGRGAGGDGCGYGAGSRGIEVSELLRTSAFSHTLAAAGDQSGAAAVHWSAWGRGDFATFAGRPRPGMRYDGDLLIGWLGVDARADGWVAGVALSHGASATDYRFDGGDAPEERGRLETTLTAFHPYARWTVTDRLELRGVLGAGSGGARHLPGGDRERENADLQTWMASLGLHLQLPPLAGIDLAARADASYARIDTAGGADYLGGLSAQRWQGRVGLEASARFALHRDAALAPFVAAAGRYDGGDGLTGAGVEVAGGLRFTAPRVLMEARGRWLAVHTEEDARELGVGVTARLGPGGQGRGLSLSVSPRWGAGGGGAQALWREEMPRLSAGADPAAFDARIGYGVGVPKERGLLTPFAEARLTGDDRRRLRVGARFEAAGERRESAAAAPEHALSLDLGLRF